MVGPDRTLFRAVNLDALPQRLQVAGPDASSRMHRTIKPGISLSFSRGHHRERSVGMRHWPHDHHGVSIRQRENSLNAIALVIRHAAGGISAFVYHVYTPLGPAKPGGTSVPAGSGIAHAQHFAVDAPGDV